jgi:hypothetical protein
MAAEEGTEMGTGAASPTTRAPRTDLGTDKMKKQNSSQTTCKLISLERSKRGEHHTVVLKRRKEEEKRSKTREKEEEKSRKITF